MRRKRVDRGRMAGESVIFIGGCMRSGTTLVQRILCAGKGAHPLPAECQYLVSLLGAYREGSRTFDLFGRDYFGSAAAFDTFNRRILEAFLALARKRLGEPEHLVLKRPELAFHFSDLALLLPAVRFLLVVRDPRDTIVSMLEVAERHAARGIAGPLVAMGRDMDRLSGFFLDYYRDAYSHADRLTGRLMTLKYENLVADPEAGLAALARFTGIGLDRASLAAPDPAKVSGAWASLAGDPAYSGAFWSESWMKELSGDSVGRYRQALSAAEIAAIEARCAGFARSFKYW
jgi:Sulfotransferase family